MRIVNALKTFLGSQIILALVLGSFVGLLSFLIEVAFAMCMQSLVLILTNADNSKIYFNLNLNNILLIAAITGVLRCVITWVSEWLINDTPNRFFFLIRKKIIEIVFNLTEIPTNKALELFHERAKVASFFIKDLQQILILGGSSFLLCLFMLYLSPKITGATLILLFIFALPTKKYSLLINNNANALLKESDSINVTLTNGLRNMIFLRIHNRLSFEREKTIAYSERYWLHQKKLNLALATLSTIPQICGVILVFFIVYAYSDGERIYGGSLLAYLYLLMRFLQSVSSTLSACTSLLLNKPALLELFYWCSKHTLIKKQLINNEILKSKNSNFIIKEPIGWQISNVKYFYEGELNSLFNGLNFRIDPGSFVTISGPSGTGKTTLLKLLLLQLKPSQGRIELILNGEKYPSEDFNPAILNYVGYVGSEDLIIDGTIRQNLIYGFDKEFDDITLNKFIVKAESEFIYKLSNGLNHVLSERGEGLSTGQIQRLSLIRALMREPKVLILDEATSNLDFETEQKLITTLSSLKGEMTIIAVTHREGLLKFSDNKISLAV